MPYIKKKDRPKFSADIKTALSMISDNQESWYNRGDYFGYYVHRLVGNWVADPAYQNHVFNSMAFAKEKRQSLTNAADSLSIKIGRSDPLGAAGNLNYCISAPYWALLGEKGSIPRASYGVRVYLRGILVKVSEMVRSQTHGLGSSNADLAKAARREIIAKGVLADVADEAYRTLTSPYEDEKREENGDLWPLVVEWRGE